MTSTLLEATDRPHVDGVVIEDDEVAALDQLDTELLGQEGMLEVGGVVDARGEDDDRRLTHVRVPARTTVRSSLPM